MSGIAKIENLKDLIIEIRGQSVLLDSDVAKIYGVETRDINKAVANNPDKFPAGYIVGLSKSKKWNWWKISTGSRNSSIPPSIQRPLPRKAYTCSPRYSRAHKQHRQQSQLLKPSQKSGSYREASKSCRLYKTKRSKNHSCKEAVN